MPFRSAKQRGFLFAKHPEIAKKWAKEHGTKIQPKDSLEVPASKVLEKKAVKDVLPKIPKD